MNDKTPSFKPPAIDGWAPWIAIIVAIAIPTVIMLVQLGEARAQLKANIELTKGLSQTAMSNTEKISDIRVKYIYPIREDLVGIKASLKNIEKQLDEKPRRRRR